MGRILVVQHYCFDRHIVFHNSFPPSCQIRLFIRIDSSMITSTITIDVSVWRKGDRLSQETFTFVFITPDATHTVRTNLDTCLSFVIGTPYRHHLSGVRLSVRSIDRQQQRRQADLLLSALRAGKID